MLVFQRVSAVRQVLKVDQVDEKNAPLHYGFWKTSLIGKNLHSM